MSRLIKIFIIGIAFFIIGGCNGGNNHPNPTPTPTANPSMTVWEIYTDCLSQQEFWGDIDYIEPEVFVTEFPCGREFAGCLTNIFFTEPRCVGEVEVKPEYTDDCTLLAEYGHSVHSQRYCECTVFPNEEYPLECPPEGLVDGNHKSELYDPMFVCFRDNLLNCGE